jgi:general secretion pathway protein C
LILTIKPQQIKVVFWAIDLVLAAAFTFIVVNAGQHLFAHPDFTSDSPVGSTTVTTMGSRPKIEPEAAYTALRKSELFGPQSSAIEAPPVRDEAPPDTTLSLQLVGVVSQGGDGLDLAIIRNTRTNAIDNYGVGDYIVPDARIEEIRDLEVIISRSGSLETLRMEWGGKASAGRPGSLRRNVPPFPAPASSSNQAIRVINENQRYVYKSKLMEQVNQNLASLLNSFRTSPNMVDGEPSGLSIDQMGSDPISGNIGIMTGDIIKSINGQPVHSIDDILEQGERLKNASVVNVQIERNGRRRTLRYTIRN